MHPKRCNDTRSGLTRAWYSNWLARTVTAYFSMLCLSIIVNSLGSEGRRRQQHRCQGPWRLHDCRAFEGPMEAADGHPKIACGARLVTASSRLVAILVAERETRWQTRPFTSLEFLMYCAYSSCLSRLRMHQPAPTHPINSNPGVSGCSVRAQRRGQRTGAYLPSALTDQFSGCYLGSSSWTAQWA